MLLLVLTLILEKERDKMASEPVQITMQREKIGRFNFTSAFFMSADGGKTCDVYGIKTDGHFGLIASMLRSHREVRTCSIDSNHGVGPVYHFHYKDCTIRLGKDYCEDTYTSSLVVFNPDPVKREACVDGLDKLLA